MDFEALESFRLVLWARDDARLPQRCPLLPAALPSSIRGSVARLCCNRAARSARNDRMTEWHQSNCNTPKRSPVLVSSALECATVAPGWSTLHANRAIRRVSAVRLLQYSTQLGCKGRRPAPCCADCHEASVSAAVTYRPATLTLGIMRQETPKSTNNPACITSDIAHADTGRFACICSASAIPGIGSVYSMNLCRRAGLILGKT